MKLDAQPLAMSAARPLRICLAASGGGHVRQILDLEHFWAEHHSFFVTEDTALGRSISQTHETHFLPHVALGQSKTGQTWEMLKGASSSLSRSLQILLKTKPDIIVTTGAGSMAFLVTWGRMLGAKIILIDSFARFEAPSKFARFVGPLAHVRIAQAQGVADRWKNSLKFDPFRILDEERPDKEPLIFATVGATLAFPRLVDIICGANASGKLREKIVLQSGLDGMKGRKENFVWSETYSFDEMKAFLRKADFVVCHGGTGSLVTALQAGCKVIAIPRRRELGEHYDDHQAEITENLRKRGLIEVADNCEEFLAAVERLRARDSIMATTDYSELSNYLKIWTAQHI